MSPLARAVVRSVRSRRRFVHSRPSSLSLGPAIPFARAVARSAYTVDRVVRSRAVVPFARAFPRSMASVLPSIALSIGRWRRRSVAPYSRPSSITPSAVGSRPLGNFVRGVGPPSSVAPLVGISTSLLLGTIRSIFSFVISLFLESCSTNKCDTRNVVGDRSFFSAHI